MTVTLDDNGVVISHGPQTLYCTIDDAKAMLSTLSDMPGKAAQQPGAFKGDLGPVLHP
jgi:hypothetical protein